MPQLPSKEKEVRKNSPRVEPSKSGLRGNTIKPVTRSRGANSDKPVKPKIRAVKVSRMANPAPENLEQVRKVKRISDKRPNKKPQKEFKAKKPEEKIKKPKVEQFDLGEELKRIWQKFKLNKSLHKFLVLALLLILLVLFSLLPVFRLEYLDSNELYLHKQESLLQASGLELNQHFLKSIGGSFASLLQGRYAGAEAKVKAAYPELKDIKLSYSFPSTLRMEVEERIPLAFLDMGELYITLDRFAVACGSYEELPQELPYISGINVMKMQIGEAIVSNADDALKNCVSVMSALFEADVENPSSLLLLPMAKEIRSSGYQRIILTLNLAEDENQELKVSCEHSDDLKKDFLSLKKVLESNALEGKLPGTLDIYGSRLVFRPEKRQTDSGEEYVWQSDILAQQEFAQEIAPEDVQE